MSKTLSRFKKQRKRKFKVPRRVQDLIPVDRFWEDGIFKTGSFYSIHTAVDCRQRHENKADKWAVKHLIPVEALDNAVAEGHTELWDLAQHFGVTEQFMRKAVCYYVHGNLAADLYF